MLGNSVWLLGSDGLGMGIALVQGILLTRFLGAAGYGVLGIVTTFVVIAGRMVSFRMSDFVVKYVSDARSERRMDQVATILRSAAAGEAGVAGLAFLFVFASAPLVNRWIVQIPEGPELIRWYSLTILAGAVFQTSTGVLHVFDRFRIQSLLQSLQYIVTLTGVSAAIILRAGMHGVVIALMVGAAVGTVGTSLLAAREVRKHLAPGWWLSRSAGIPGGWRGAARFLGSTNISETASLIVKESDVLWLGYFRNATEVGYYRLAVSLAALVVKPIAPLIHTIYPEIAAHVSRKQWRALRGLLQRASVLSTAYVLPMLLVSFVFAHALVRLLYGAEFLPAVGALRILLVGVGFASIFFWTRAALLGLHHAGYQMRIHLGLGIVKLVAVVILLPRYGYIGNAAILTGLYIIGTVLCVAKLISELRLHVGSEVELGWVAVRGGEST